MTLPASPDAAPVLRAVIGAARAEFGRQLEALFVMGSLAHGGFAPLVSSVDVLVVPRRLTVSTAGRMAVVATDVWERVPGPLTQRLALSWADADGVRRGGGRGRLPAADRLDVLDSGALLAGRDVREPALRPSRGELVHEAALAAFDRFDPAAVRELLEPTLLLVRGVGPVTAAVLWPLRCCFTLATGRIGSVEDVVAWFRAVGEPPPAIALADAAVRWRYVGLPSERAAVRLLAALPLLYRRFVDAHALALDGRAPATQLQAAFADVG